MEKKKLFISCPMKGATKEEMDKRMLVLHKLAEIYFGEDLEAIDTWIEEGVPQNCKNTRAWYAGESIKRLSEADYYVGINANYYDNYFKCFVENYIAGNMGIPIHLIEKEIILPKNISER